VQVSRAADNSIQMYQDLFAQENIYNYLQLSMVA